MPQPLTQDPAVIKPLEQKAGEPKLDTEPNITKLREQYRDLKQKFDVLYAEYEKKPLSELDNAKPSIEDLSLQRIIQKYTNLKNIIVTYHKMILSGKYKLNYDDYVSTLVANLRTGTKALKIFLKNKDPLEKAYTKEYEKLYPTTDDIKNLTRLRSKQEQALIQFLEEHLLLLQRIYSDESKDSALLVDYTSTFTDRLVRSLKASKLTNGNPPISQPVADLTAQLDKLVLTKKAAPKPIIKQVPLPKFVVSTKAAPEPLLQAALSETKTSPLRLAEQKAVSPTNDLQTIKKQIREFRNLQAFSGDFPKESVTTYFKLIAEEKDLEKRLIDQKNKLKEFTEQQSLQLANLIATFKSQKDASLGTSLPELQQELADALKDLDYTIAPIIIPEALEDEKFLSSFLALIKRKAARIEELKRLFTNDKTTTLERVHTKAAAKISELQQSYGERKTEIQNEYKSVLDTATLCQVLCDQALVPPASKESPQPKKHSPKNKPLESKAPMDEAKAAESKESKVPQDPLVSQLQATEEHSKSIKPPVLPQALNKYQETYATLLDAKSSSPRTLQSLEDEAQGNINELNIYITAAKNALKTKGKAIVDCDELRLKIANKSVSCSSANRFRKLIRVGTTEIQTKHKEIKNLLNEDHNGQALSIWWDTFKELRAAYLKQGENYEISVLKRAKQVEKRLENPVYKASNTVMEAIEKEINRLIAKYYEDYDSPDHQNFMRFLKQVFTDQHPIDLTPRRIMLDEIDCRLYKLLTMYQLFKKINTSYINGCLKIGDLNEQSQNSFDYKYNQNMIKMVAEEFTPQNIELLNENFEAWVRLNILKPMYIAFKKLQFHASYAIEKLGIQIHNYFKPEELQTIKERKFVNPRLPFFACKTEKNIFMTLDSVEKDLPIRTYQAT